MRATLVEANLKADNVLPTVSAGTPAIDVFCSLLDFRAPLKMAVVRPLVQIDGLALPECHFEGTVMIADEDESGTTIRLYLAVSLEWMPPQHRESVQNIPEDKR